MGITTVDSLFKQNLSEWVYDEHKLVTYQYLSIALQVHVNVAKQMLYEFYKEQKKKTKSAVGIHALYHVSGLIQSPESDKWVYTTTICGEDQLESVTGKFSSLSSIHIYAIRATEEDGNGDNGDSSSMIKKLSSAFKEVVLMKADEDGVSTVGLGPFIGTKPKPKDSTTASLPPASSASSISSASTLESTKSKSGKPIQSIKSSPIKKQDPKKGTKQKESPWWTKTGAVGGKAKIEVKTESPSKNTPSSSANTSTSLKKRSRSDDESGGEGRKTRSSIPQKKNGNGALQGIKDLLDSDSDSTSENESVKSSPPSSPPRVVSPPPKRKKKAPVPPASPPSRKSSEPKRRRILQLVDSSDSDDDFKPPPKQSSPPNPRVEESKKGKRKTKVVTTQVMDEDGYLVTKREKVSDSGESDGDEAPVAKKESPVVTPQPVKKSNSSSSSDKKSPPLKSPPVKKPTKRTASTASGSKSKQTTLTSFFIKKA